MKRGHSVSAAGGLASTGVPPGGPRGADTHRLVNATRRVNDSAGRRAEQAGRLCYPPWCNALVAIGLLLLAGCRRDMVSQARVDPLEASSFFADGAGARPVPAHTVAQGQLEADTLFYTGHAGDGQLSAVFPEPVTKPMLERGAERYGIYCTPCHGSLGDGRGIIVGHGFPAPPTFHQPRLREAPPGHFYEVITNGLGLMYPYGSRVRAGGSLGDRRLHSRVATEPERQPERRATRRASTMNREHTCQSEIDARGSPVRCGALCLLVGYFVARPAVLPGVVACLDLLG